jgi:sortase A
MVVGVLMFGFVAYQLWGTGIEFRQHQNELERQFSRQQEALTDSPVTASPSSADEDSDDGATPATPSEPAESEPGGSTDDSPVTTTAASLWPTIELGDVLAQIEIPKLSKRVFAVAGIRTEDLKQGLGHYPDTPLPGQFGNVAFAGHRTTYGAPLFSVDELVAGDEIVVTTITNQRYVYKMVGEARIVSPRDYGVIRDADPTKASLTLTSCHPRYSAKKRIVVHAELDTTQSGPVQFATPFYGQTVDQSALLIDPDGEPDSSVVTDPDGSGVREGPVAVQIDAPPVYEGAEALSRGWFHDSAAWPQIGVWAGALTALVLAAYLLNRRLRRYWPGIVLAAMPFLIGLYFFYQNVNRLLPPDL